MDEVIEMFGKKLKVVTDESNSADFCYMCAVKVYCWKGGGDPICEDAEGKENRHFEEVID